MGSFDNDLFYNAVPQFPSNDLARAPLFVQSPTIRSLEAVLCEVRDHTTTPAPPDMISGFVIR